MTVSQSSSSSDIPQMLVYEEEAYGQGLSTVCGLDEAGRGPLAGPVFAACCILPRGYFHPEITDSKKLSPEKRIRLYEEIRKNQEILISFACAEVEEIDRINIFEATKEAMRKALLKLAKVPDILLVDGLYLDGVTMVARKIIQGDSLSLSIAAASIVAKVERDFYMDRLATKYPGWGFEKHRGYGTKSHFENLNKLGYLPGVHRVTFEPVKTMVLTGL